ncbi:MAG: SGNH/GDSL hydrolase family protein [Verrucomicrobia bacterium]|nr:SGNH/GDSL hydrolase family protein [Verrucomicrobiota bacterium]MCG2679482.1 SGNH/GDSL hydrolase family protein [Kiritimatiellia bacterium]MBU4247617.1 SGNH/GDSL hydrolase family protein [Verrucomicrobiota bacterium]MBU4290657.1 SGNH/GDSL hydrolase family protein [Verrucomicrobiota bacterium]MBU4430377.1 SGNH/GDSL hydrolase family protein [Verrucomicrobiota bacterium]
MLKRVLFRMVLFLLAAGLVVLADYIAGRLYPRLAPASGQAAVASLLGDEEGKQTGYFLQHPYLYYTYRPSYQAFNAVQFNTRGHRSAEVTQLPEPGVLRILAIGGSTTVCFPYVKYFSEAWPARLEAMLRQKTGLGIEVINAGLHDANSADLLLHYLFRNRYLKPDMVVMHVGGNDGVALLFNDYNPEYTHYTHGWRNTSLAPRPWERRLLQSNLIKLGYAWWLRQLSLAANLGRDDIRSLSPEQCLNNARVHEPEGFERNLDLLVRTVLQDKAVPVLFPFVWAPLPVCREAGGYGPYAEALVCGFEKDRPVLKKIGEKYGLTTVWLPTNAIPDSLFVDFCHVNSDGETIKARYLADALIPVIQALNQDGRYRRAGSPAGSDKRQADILYRTALEKKQAGEPPSQQRAALMEVLTEYPRHEPALQDLLRLWQDAKDADQVARVTVCLKNWFQPAVPAPAALANGILLLGVTLDRTACRAGEQFKITYFWQCPPPVAPADAFTVFVHFVAGANRFQDDHEFLAGIPRGDLAFQPFPETFAVERIVSVPAAVPPGEYRLWLGLYNRATGERTGVRTTLTTRENAVEIPVVIRIDR